MRFVAYRENRRVGLAVRTQGGLHGVTEDEAPELAGGLDALIAQGPQALNSAAALIAARGRPLDESGLELRPPFSRPEKIICIGLNYADHTAEAKMEQPSYPTVFTRFASTLVGAGQPVIRPQCSTKLDYEGELVAVIGKAGRHIRREDALGHVAGYSVFNDVSVRDYQFKSPQWTMGKNFDGSGPFGPEFVTADELPPGCKGLRLQTRLNGQVVQEASTDDMLFDVVELVALLSEVMTLVPGDVIVTGTPAGVGFARKPPLWMKHGDLIEVEIEQVGLLSNPVVDEATLPNA